MPLRAKLGRSVVKKGRARARKGSREPRAKEALPKDSTMVAEKKMTAADFDDTPASELTMLPSKLRVKKLMGKAIRFAEPKFHFDSPAACSATLTAVRRSLRGIDSEALDRMLQEQKEPR